MEKLLRKISWQCCGSGKMERGCFHFIIIIKADTSSKTRPSWIGEVNVIAGSWSWLVVDLDTDLSLFGLHYKFGLKRHNRHILKTLSGLGHSNYLPLNVWGSGDSLILMSLKSSLGWRFRLRAWRFSPKPNCDPWSGWDESVEPPINIDPNTTIGSWQFERKDVRQGSKPWKGTHRWMCWCAWSRSPSLDSRNLSPWNHFWSYWSKEGQDWWYWPILRRTQIQSWDYGSHYSSWD